MRGKPHQNRKRVMIKHEEECPTWRVKWVLIMTCMRISWRWAEQRRLDISFSQAVYLVNISIRDENPRKKSFRSDSEITNKIRDYSEHACSLLQEKRTCYITWRILFHDFLTRIQMPLSSHQTFIWSLLFTAFCVCYFLISLQAWYFNWSTRTSWVNSWPKLPKESSSPESFFETPVVLPQNDVVYESRFCFGPFSVVPDIVFFLMYFGNQ